MFVNRKSTLTLSVPSMTSFKDSFNSCAEKLSIRSITFHPISSQRLNHFSHSEKIFSVIQIFLFACHIMFNFSAQTPLTEKVFDICAVSIIHSETLSSSVAFVHRLTVILTFEFFPSLTSSVARVLSGVVFQYKAVSFMLNMFHKWYGFKFTCNFISFSFTCALFTPFASSCCTYFFIL